MYPAIKYGGCAIIFLLFINGIGVVWPQQITIVEGLDYSLRSPNPSAAQLLSYIKTKYEQIINGRACLFYPASSPKRLVITFGYAIADRYAMWTWFWRTNEQWADTAYLFLKDDDLCWYLGDNAKGALDDYCSMINHFVNLCGVPKDRVFTAGGSMGGYGAILFATLLGFKGAIVDIPTVRKDIWHKYQPPNTTKIRSQDRWIDLDELLARSATVPLISIHHGKSIADVVAAHALMDVIIDRAPLIIYRTTAKSAHSVFTITKASLESDIAYMEKYDINSTATTLVRYPRIECNGAQFSFGYGRAADQALQEGIDGNTKGIMLVHPYIQEPAFDLIREKIAPLNQLPFVSITYNNDSRYTAYAILKIMRDKIGCFTLHYQPQWWQMNARYLEEELQHLGKQKLLQLPHFT